MSLTTVDGRYQVITRIASGGMGEVFRAHDAVLAREVAIKVLHSTLANDAAFIDRFRREARAAALLSHPNIVAVHDWGATDGTYFMVMEFVRGRNLRDLLTTGGPLDPAQAIELLLPVLAALEHAHRAGIVHRDIKPENILLTTDGVPKVADFGLARAFAESRVTQAPGTVTGTVQYLAPEQIQGEPADPRTDLYALGVVAYELLTGRVPFTGETSVAIAYKHLTDDVPPPSRRSPAVPESLDRIVLRATARERDRRYASAGEMRADLEAAARELPPAAPLWERVRTVPDGDEPIPRDRAATVTIPRALSPRARRRRLRRRVAGFLALLLALAGLSAAAWTYVVPHYTHAPSVLGLTGPVAQQRLEKAGLDVRIGPNVYSTKYAEGLVARQSIAPGARVKKGSGVVLNISQGPPLRAVPDVHGKPLKAAQDALRSLGLGWTLHYAYSDTVSIGHVIDQNPSPRQQLAVGQKVTLTVSRGPEPVAVPEVKGQTEQEAEAILQAAGFTVVPKEEFSDTVPAGSVTRSDPLGGTMAPKGSQVTIWVSKGPRTFPMPRVVGMHRDAAVALLESKGLVVRVVQLPGTSGDGVVYQLPSAGTTVHSGENVTIYIA